MAVDDVTMPPRRSASGAAASLPPDLLRAAVTALARGLARPAAARPDAEADIAAIYLERIARDLTGEEASILESIAGTRERGLALCRAGQVHDGGSIIAQARSVLTRANLSREAFVLSDSFLCASEGFAHYKSGRADAAISSMRTAIDRCRELRDAYGYPVEGRRIHLACSTERVRVDAAEHEESSITVAQLLNLIDTSDRRFWPYPDLEYASEPDRLDDDVRWELMDQALAVARRLDRKALGQVAAAFPTSPGGITQPLVTRTRCFLAAVRAHSLGDHETFLARCAEFFPADAQHLPRTFAYLANRLAAIRASAT
jgi:hypothetical protein